MRVVIIGAGFGGIAAAVELQRCGITEVTILEKAPDFGGTWFHNTYPGVLRRPEPSVLVLVRPAPRLVAALLPQREIFDYVHEVARDLGIDRLIRTGTAVTACSWDDAACRWSVETEQGDVRGGRGHRRDRSAPQASDPPIEGAETFGGPQASTPPSGTTTTT